MKTLIAIIAAISFSACGVDGIQGRPGNDGVDGTNGADGLDGSDGVDGGSGKDGEDGKDGANGMPGAENRIVSNLTCHGYLDCTGCEYSYNKTTFANGDVFAFASIGKVSAAAMHKAGTGKALSGYVFISDEWSVKAGEGDVALIINHYKPAKGMESLYAFITDCETSIY